MLTYKRNMFGTVLIYGAIIIGLATCGRLACSSVEYADYPFPFTKGTDIGRTKNGISTVIAGVVGREMYPQSAKIDLTIEKSMWPDAHVTGYSTSNSVNTEIKDLTFSNVHFTAAKGPKGNLEGTVEKSEFNWEVEQDIAKKDRYNIERAFYKFDSDLELHANNGKIEGTYHRKIGWNWGINGTYDKDGNVKVNVSVPAGLDFQLNGKITPGLQDTDNK